MKSLLQHAADSARKGLASASDDRWGAIGLLLLVVLILAAPGSFGGVTQEGAITIEVLAFGSAACALASVSPVQRLGFLVWPLGAMILLALLGALQLLPLPSLVLAAISPESARIWDDARSLLSTFDRAVLPVPRISIAPAETVATLLLVLAYAAAFVASLRLTASRPARRILLAALLGGAAYRILTALQGTSGEGRVSGPFVNPDHFAGWLEISIPFALALLLLGGHRIRQALPGASQPDPGHGLEKRLAATGGALLLWVLLGAGAYLTHSRGGMIAIVASTFVFVVLRAAAPYAYSKSLRRGLVDGVGSALVGLVFIVIAVGREPLLRFLALDPREVGEDQRVWTWQISVEAWKRFPVVGSGLGTFREAFRLVQPREFGGLLEQAHQDGLQLLVTGGVVGALLGSAAVLLTAAYLVRSWHTARRTEERLLGLAGLSALVSLLVHGLAEFNFSIPAIPVTLAAALGVAIAAIRWEGDQR